VVYLIIKFRTKQLAADKNKLEQLVNERTAQLKQSLSVQDELLTEKDVLTPAQMVAFAGWPVITGNAPTVSDAEVDVSVVGVDVAVTTHWYK